MQRYCCHLKQLEYLTTFCIVSPLLNPQLGVKRACRDKMYMKLYLGREVKKIFDQNLKSTQMV